MPHYRYGCVTSARQLFPVGRFSQYTSKADKNTKLFNNSIKNSQVYKNILDKNLKKSVAGKDLLQGEQHQYF